jgi:sec-independent protein translocase protein TatA
MFGLGWTEVAVILLVAIVIFGPKKIPELGGTFGKTLRNFKDGLRDASEDSLLEAEEEDRTPKA